MSKFHLHFLSIFIFTLCTFIACGKKTTNIYNPAQSGIGVASPATPALLGGGDSSGGSGSGSEPSPGGADPAGGELISDEIGTIYTIMANEDYFKKWFSESIHFFMAQYGIFFDENDLINEFFLKIDKSNKNQCFENTKKLNFEYKQKMISDIDFKINEIIAAQDVPVKTPELFSPQIRYKTIEEFLNYQKEAYEKNGNAMGDFVERYKGLNCENSFREFLKTIRFDLRRYSSCETTPHTKTSFQKNNPSKDATYSFQNNKHTICVSIIDLSKKLTSAPESHIIGLIMHEISHAFGYDEIDAINIQNYFTNQNQINFQYMRSNASHFNLSHLMSTKNLSGLFLNFLKIYSAFLNGNNTENIDIQKMQVLELEKLKVAIQTTLNILFNLVPEDSQITLQQKNGVINSYIKIEDFKDVKSVLRSNMDTIVYTIQLILTSKGQQTHPFFNASELNSYKNKDLYLSLIQFLELNTLVEINFFNSSGYIQYLDNNTFNMFLPPAELPQ